MTAIELLDRAVQMERLARLLYESLALRHADDPARRQLFLAMALEEEQHGFQIRALARHLTVEELDPEVARRLADTMTTTEAEVRDFIAAASGPEPIAIEETLRRVIAVERRYVALHPANLCSVVAPRMVPLYASLARQERNHLELLEAKEG